MKISRLFPRTSRVLANYFERVRAFQPNARLYLTSVILTGAAMGVFRLLFNFLRPLTGVTMKPCSAR